MQLAKNKDNEGKDGWLKAGVTGSGKIVTDIDRMQARFEAGDAVAFIVKDGSKKTGTVEKFNPKTARVRCEGEVWNVPYHLLHHLDETRREGNEERLLEVAGQARELMDEHGLEAWTFCFSATQNSLGQCREQEQLIRLSRRHAVRDAPHEVRDTILHEVAHALAGTKAKHGPAWKAVAKRIGATPKARAEESGEAHADRQAAKAGFRRGMEVSFRSRDGDRRTGIIVRMNSRRASVRCSGALFLVPYSMLDPVYH